MKAWVQFCKAAAADHRHLVKQQEAPLLAARAASDLAWGALETAPPAHFPAALLAAEAATTALRTLEQAGAEASTIHNVQSAEKHTGHRKTLSPT